MLRRVLTLLMCLVIATPGLVVAEMSVDAIIKNVDDNTKLGPTHAVARLTIKSGARVLEKEMETWSDGQSKAFVTFHNPEDKGTRYLKVGSDLWMYFPDAENTVKIAGHMLRQGMMGSDFSYEDALEEEKLAREYDFSLTGSKQIDGRNCYVIKATAKPGVEVAYATRVSWIDKERFVVLYEELYASSGKLLKTAHTYDVKRVNGRWVPMRMVMENKLRANSSTTFVFTSLETGVKIPADTFSLRSLNK